MSPVASSSAGRAGGGGPRLSVRGLKKRFGPTQALGGVDLEVRAGEVHALVGENGAGKSTLLKALAGVHAPDEGEMRLEGVRHAPRDPAAARAAGLAIIHQELALAPHLTIAENLFLGREPRRGLLVDRRAMAERARAALATVGREQLDPQRLVATLPPADRQLVEIARALAQDVRVLVLDEPTSSLTQQDVDPLLQRLRALAASGVAVVYVSHVFEELFAVADRYTVLRDGRTVTSGAMSDIDHDGLVAAMVGREIGDMYRRSDVVPGLPRDEVLAIEDVSGRALPIGASLSLRRGEVLGLAGLVGAGRTELLRCVFGLDEVRSGRVRIAGLERVGTPRERVGTPRASWAAGVGMLSEDRKHEGLMLQRSLADNLWLPCLSRRARGGFVSSRGLERDAVAWLERLGVKARGPGQAARELSGGNQQKVALARLLAAECDVLLLDEPTRGVDVGAKAELYARIDELAHRDGRAVLVVSSYLPELLGLCDRVAVVSRGRLLPPRPIAGLGEHALLTAMTTGVFAGGAA
ncbi:MAG: sugar ABC transporter ATP-binding protein [Planctomycetes bacterium]|nr:sugar ABC transporter ATP-binding protein [Planctomycetota bacterium]